MNGLKVTAEVEFTDDYTEAKRKFFDFVAAMNKLSPAQKEQLARDCLAATGMIGLLQQFIDFMNNRGNR